MFKLTRAVHASVLLEMGPLRLLTDPWLTDRPGWRRSEPLGLAPRALSRLDAVLVSHGHPDHFDLAGLKAASPDALARPLLLRKGHGHTAAQLGYRHVHELDHWESLEPIPGLKVTATPALHSSPENSYVIEAGGHTVFFGGDTRLAPAFAEIARRFPSIDLALLPVNGVRLFGMRTVMDPAEAVQACRILKPQVVVPIHYGMASGWKAGWMLRQPGTPHAFRELITQSGLPTRVELLPPGITLTLPGARNA